ncbi:MAG TPA: hypothetical protein VHD15_09645 [Hyphomicrobiales bacterium]|nr:hypothetical protein [Hyphomicrobiales bacterium]
MTRFLSAAAFSLVAGLFALPASAADCSNAIADFQAMLDRDVQMGLLSPKVHDTATDELKADNATCRAGENGRALSELESIKRRHGYH